MLKHFKLAPAGEGNLLSYHGDETKSVALTVADKIERVYLLGYWV